MGAKQKKAQDKDGLGQARQGLPTLVKKRRECLKCEKKFLSEHAGNRICPKCTNSLKMRGLM